MFISGRPRTLNSLILTDAKYFDLKYLILAHENGISFFIRTLSNVLDTLLLH